MIIIIIILNGGLFRTAFGRINGSDDGGEGYPKQIHGMIVTLCPMESIKIIEGTVHGSFDRPLNTYILSFAFFFFLYPSIPIKTIFFLFFFLGVKRSSTTNALDHVRTLSKCYRLSRFGQTIK